MKVAQEMPRSSGAHLVGWIPQFITSFVVMFGVIQGASCAGSPGEEPLSRFTLTGFAVTGLRGNVIWRDMYSGSWYFEPLACESSKGRSQCSHWHEVDLSIDSSVLSAIEAQFVKEGDLFRIEYLVTLRNGVQFHAAEVSSRLDFDAMREGVPAQVQYEWPTSNLRFERRELAEQLKRVVLPSAPDKSLEVTWGDGRKESATKWEMIVGSSRNRLPIVSDLLLAKENATVKVPGATVRKFRYKPGGYFNTFTLQLFDGRKIEGEIPSERSWHGALDIAGLPVWMNAPWWFVEDLEITDSAKGAGTVKFRSDKVIFFASNRK